jgi:hypothetical protein
MKTRYSPSVKSFYPFDLEYGDNLPSDVIEVTIAEYEAAMARPNNMDFDFLDGQLVISAKPTPAFEPQRDGYMATVRTTREAILNRLAGLGFAAMADDNTQAVTAIKTARQALLDITSDPSVLASTTIEGLKVAVLARYKAIAAAVPVDIRTAFDKVAL